MKKYAQYGSIKKFFHENDMFKSPANLRVTEQPDVSQKCTGIFSMLLFLLFMYVMASQFLKLDRYQSIESTQFQETELNLSKPRASNLVFSIVPAWAVYSLWSKMFEVQVSLVSGHSLNQTQVPIQMERCRAEQWSKYSKIYQTLQFGDNLCPKYPEKISIQGANYNQNQTVYLSIKIKRCQNSSTCFNNSKMERSLDKLYPVRNNFGSLYLIDTSINGQKKQPVQQYLRMNYDFVFTNQSFSHFEIYLGTYIIETDTNIWPLTQNIDSISGYYIEDRSQTYTDKTTVVEDLYGDVKIFMGNRRKRFVRTVGKIDAAVSYAGGLFGILIGFFSYFLNSYNEYSYQLRVAESAFNYDEHGNKVKEKHFNFLRYIQFTAYDWIKFMLCIEKNWQYCVQKDQTRQQANMTMDVMHLFRKIQLIELVLSYLTDSNETMLQFLTNPPTLTQVQNRRECMEYYNAVIRGKVAINIEDIKNKSESLNQYKKTLKKFKEEEGLLGLLKTNVSVGVVGIGGEPEIVGEKVQKRKDYKEMVNKSSSMDSLIHNFSINDSQRINTYQGSNNNLNDETNQKDSNLGMVNYGYRFINLFPIGNDNNPSSRNLNQYSINQSHSSSPPQPSSSSLPSKKSIITKLTLYSAIESPTLIQQIAQYPELAHEAITLELYPEMLKVECQFAEAYRQLKPEIRDKIVDRIPLKILHRLVECIGRGIEAGGPGLSRKKL